MIIVFLYKDRYEKEKYFCMLYIYVACSSNVCILYRVSQNSWVTSF
jgi:hypothetical protein